ncbi:hypothetical protein N9U70_00325, partial [Paracoccaceae bacterium]|nr:hypothetical protein [Paracoccaceae bacterium]
GRLVFQHTFAPVIEKEKWHIMGTGQIWPGNKMPIDKLLDVLKKCKLDLEGCLPENYVNIDNSKVTKYPSMQPSYR